MGINCDMPLQCKNYKRCCEVCTDNAEIEEDPENDFLGSYFEEIEEDD